MRKSVSFICALLISVCLAMTGCTPSVLSSGDENPQASLGSLHDAAEACTVYEDQPYTDAAHVAAYIHTFKHLPNNFISKTKAKQRGWDSSEGNLDEAAPGMSIGGSRYYNDDALLPDAQGRHYTECDIDYAGGYRGAKRIIYSNDGLVFYTEDHYQTFEQVY